MAIVYDQSLTHQSVYAKKLRPFLPKEAFLPDTGKPLILCLNLVILIFGWAIASYLNQWAWYLMPLFLPFALLMGNSVVALAFTCHDLLHSQAIKSPRLRRLASLLGLTIVWMPPTLWKTIHNRAHHNHTNALADPDRNYLQQQPNTWGKWFQNQFVPSVEVKPLRLMFGMATVWGFYVFRNLTAVILFNRESVNYVPASVKVSAKEKRAIALELLVMVCLHFLVLWSLQFDPLKLLLSYFLPISIGYAGIIFYIYTNHLACRMTDVNDPLINSISLKVPKLFDLLHFNFSYHAEHHIFPGINSDYYPLVQTLIKEHYPTKVGYILRASDAWRLLLQTPRHYQDEMTLTTWSGKTSIPCPLNAPTL